MKTLADFKRRLAVGTKVRVTNFLRLGALKPWQTATEDGQATQWTSAVAKVQSNSVGFKVDGKPGEDLSWLQWPKASEFKIEDDKAVIYWEDGRKCLTYEFV